MVARMIKIPADESELQVKYIKSFEYPVLNTELFGPDELIELVRPRGLQHFNGQRTDGGIILIVDENGLYKPEPMLNRRASILYGTYVHGQPIVGDVYVSFEMPIIVEEDGDSYEELGLASLPSDVTIETIETAVQQAQDYPSVFAF